MTLNEFLLARIAEEETRARAAGKGHWQVECWLDRTFEPVNDTDRAAHLAGFSHADECVVDGDDIRIYDEGGHSREQAVHIAYWNPARVLAECEAKRQVIAATFVVAQTIDGEWGCCHTADQIRDAPLSDCYGPHVAAEFLKPLALPYAEHPDLPEWKP